MKATGKKRLRRELERYNYAVLSSLTSTLYRLDLKVDTGDRIEFWKIYCSAFRSKSIKQVIDSAKVIRELQRQRFIKHLNKRHPPVLK